MPGRCLACFLLFALAPAAVGADAPFTEYEIHSEWSTANARVVHFGRADGSRGARTTETLNGRTCTTTTIWDIVSHRKITWSDCAGVITRETFVHLPMAAKPADCVRSNLDKHAGTEKLGELILEKFESSGTTYRMVYGLAPQLGCLDLWGRSESSDGKVSTKQPVQVRLGPPSPELFTVPDTYREVTAAEWRAALTKYYKTAEK